MDLRTLSFIVIAENEIIKKLDFPLWLLLDTEDNQLTFIDFLTKASLI
jgi:hypothetical protein